MSATTVSISGHGRGLYTEPATGRLFAVVGGYLVEVSADSTAVVRGSIAGDDPVTWASNGKELAICGGGHIYILKLSTSDLSLYFASGATEAKPTAAGLTDVTPGSEAGVTSLTGQATLWGELRALGNSAAWPALGAEPDPSGYGFLWDSPRLESMQILSGNWTPAVKLSTSSETITADIVVRAYKLTAAGVYSLIAKSVTPGQVITSTPTVFSGTPVAVGTPVSFSAGDRLYIDILLNISLNQSSDAQATTSLSVNGGAGEVLVTPGYQGTPGVLAQPVDGTQVAYMDGSFIAILPDSQKFRVSELYDGMTWDDAMVAEVEASPDRNKGVLVDRETIWMFGSETVQPFGNSGNVDFPFEPVQGGLIQQGCIAPLSPVRIANTIAWLGGDSRGVGTAWRAEGFNPTRISTHGVENEWSKYSRLDDAVSYSWIYKGHSLWVISFPTADRTWVYDATASALLGTHIWTEWLYWEASSAAYRATLARFHTYAFGKHLALDWRNGKVYEVSDTTYQDAGDSIRRERVFPHVSQEQLLMFAHKIQIHLEAGVGIASGQGSNPTLLLSWSDDGGHTWSNEVELSIGMMGKYGARAICWRLGAYRDRVYKIVITDPVWIALLDCYIDGKLGPR